MQEHFFALFVCPLFSHRMCPKTKQLFKDRSLIFAEWLQSRFIFLYVAIMRFQGNFSNLFAVNVRILAKREV
ncbi:MAG TPA: hypothetical protein VN446_06945, partial [Candidatus Acidoferrum sp.]|nr:hypothetical protein [Candidatus Acidoferrum sp.]